MLKPEIQKILKDYGIETFELFQDDLFSITIRSNDKIKDSALGNFVDEIQIAAQPLKIKFEKLSKETEKDLKLIDDFHKARDAYIDKKLAESKFDPVEKPAHYNFGKFEVIEVIEDWQLSYKLGNAVKYIARAGRKDPAKKIEDLKKAYWYLGREITELSREKLGGKNEA